MPSRIITLYFGEVSFSPAKPSLVTSGACAIYDASISWPCSLIEAPFVGVSMAGVCVTSCSLLTKSSSWWSIFGLSYANKTVPSDANRDRGTTSNS